jgi:hypothetical protein
MTEQVEVEGVVSAEVDTVRRRIVPKGVLGAETSSASLPRAFISWNLRGATGEERFIETRSRTLAERVNEAYKDKLEPKEKELLDRAAEQFGRRLSSQE